MTKLDLSITKLMDYETFVKIIADIPSCIFFKNLELKYQFSSHCWTQLVSDDIVGKTDIEIRKDTENAIRAMEEDRQIIATKKGRSYVIKSEIDGEVNYLELIKEPIISAEGDVIGIVGLINDITQKTIMEQKVERMHASQKMFTASMNHELRSPLNGIIGNLQLLMSDDTLNNEQSKIIESAYKSSQLMLEMVNELLDFAKAEMNGFTIKKEAFRLSSMIDSIMLQQENQAKSKGLEFSITCDVKEDVIISDETRILQIIYNIVSNAIKYTEKGSVKLKILYENPNLVFSCTDTGQGISEESMQYLFDPYVRFNEERNIHIQGTGLGLSVVKKIVDSMEGQISVDSKVEAGSTFTVKIPVIAATEEDLILDKSEHREVKNIDFSKLKALCIDDSKINGKVMASLLEKAGMACDVENSAEEGIKKADENKYDIIFMDHMMPDMDGIEAFEIIRSRSVKNSNTPVIMLTGNVAASYTDLYMEKGLDGYLAKPVLMGSLMEEITTVLGEKD